MALGVHFHEKRQMKLICVVRELQEKAALNMRVGFFNLKKYLVKIKVMFALAAVRSMQCWTLSVTVSDLSQFFGKGVIS